MWQPKKSTIEYWSFRRNRKSTRKKKSRNGWKPSTRWWRTKARTRLRAPRRADDRARESGVEVPVHLNTPYVNTIPVDEEDSLSRRSRIERASRAWSAGTRWPWCIARTRKIPASAATSRLTLRWRRCGSRLQSFLPREVRRSARRFRLFPGTLLARRLCPRVSGRPVERSSRSRTSATNCASARTCRRIRIPG